MFLSPSRSGEKFIRERVVRKLGIVAAVSEVLLYRMKTREGKRFGRFPSEIRVSKRRVLDGVQTPTTGDTNGDVCFGKTYGLHLGLY